MVCSRDSSFEVSRINNKLLNITKAVGSDIRRAKACRFSSNGQVAFAGDQNKVGLYKNISSNYDMIS